MKYTYLDYLYHEIGLKIEDVKAIAQSGSNDDAVREVAKEQYIQDQLKDLSDRWLISAADGLCDSPENNTNRQAAIAWLVWMAAWDIFEEM